MERGKVVDSSAPVRKMRPALTPEAQESQLVQLAMDLAQKQLVEGTASSQVITHYLKLGSMREKKEMEILENQKELIAAKTRSLASTKEIEELYGNALEAFKSYRGHEGSSDDY